METDMVERRVTKEHSLLKLVVEDGEPYNRKGSEGRVIHLIYPGLIYLLP